MIHFNFTISNPWWRDRHGWIASKHWKVTKNKTLELEFDKSHSLFDFEFSLSARRDHAGVSMMFGLLGYTLGLSFYDNRHYPADGSSSWL